MKKEDCGFLVLTLIGKYIFNGFPEEEIIGMLFIELRRLK